MNDEIKNQKEATQKSKKFVLSKRFLYFLIPAVFFVTCIASFSVYVVKRSADPQPKILTETQQTTFLTQIKARYPQKTITPLPYETIPAKLSIFAKSAILIDESNGCILFEKNADILIPPASMAKLMVMYIVFQEIEKRTFQLTDFIDLPPQTWAKNAPPQSSLMFLGEGQTVTLDELLLGLAVPSGNDAAVAVALAVSGSVDAFIERMNDEAKKLGLSETVFVDSSGYSELNLTTARDFVSFCRIYTLKYPEALARYHSARSITYPQTQNLSPNLISSYKAITQNTTNKMLDIIAGCDGLKTGFIPESGYNMALTVKRNHMRIIAVMMGGQGTGTAEGNKYRLADSTTLTNWAYSAFETLPTDSTKQFPIRVWKGKEQAVNLTATMNAALTVPKINGKTAENVQKIIDLPKSISAPIKAGQAYGKIVYKIENIVLQEVPLIADRNIERSNFLKCAIDAIAQRFVQ